MPAKRKSPLWLRRSAAFFVLLLVAACGGGGGGGGDPAPQPLTYTGNTSPATISATNAGTLSSAATSSSGGDVDSATSSVAAPGETLAGGSVSAQRIARDVRASLMQPDPAFALTSIPVDETESCPHGGTRRVVGDISQSGTGTLQAVYTNCGVESGKIFNGTASLRIDTTATVLGRLLPTDFTVTFSPLAVRGTKSIDMAGSVRFQIDVPTNTETVTENIVARDNGTGRMLKWENLRTIIVYNDINAPTSYTARVDGRVYDSVHGFVDIATTVPLVFATLTQEHPNGGQMVLTGANNARLRINVLSASLVELQLDLDNNNTWEVTAFITWAQLSGQAGADIADNDGDGMHNSWETAVGLNPGVNDAALDKDGDGVNNLAEYRAGTNP
jgi:hypothetical protein